jgi:hypothetical protein
MGTCKVDDFASMQNPLLYNFRALKASFASHLGRPVSERFAASGAGKTLPLDKRQKRMV